MLNMGSGHARTTVKSSGSELTERKAQLHLLFAISGGLLRLLEPEFSSRQMGRSVSRAKARGC